MSVLIERVVWSAIASSQEDGTAVGLGLAWDENKDSQIEARNAPVLLPFLDNLFQGGRATFYIVFEHDNTGLFDGFLEGVCDFVMGMLAQEAMY